MAKNICTLLVFLPALFFSTAMAQRAGIPDSSFATNGFLAAKIGPFDHKPADVVVQPDGKILVGGVLPANNYSYLMRYNNDGSTDTTFAAGVGVSTRPLYTDGFRKIVLLPGGKIVAAGEVETASNGLDIYLQRYLPNGTPDSSFGINSVATKDYNNVGNTMRDVVVQPDGKIVVASEIYGLLNSVDFSVMRFNANGTVDSSFGTNGNTMVDMDTIDNNPNTLALQSDGKIIVAGTNHVNPTTDTIAFMRFTTSGHLDTTFATGGKRKIILPGANLISGISMLANNSFLLSGFKRTYQPYTIVPFVIKITAKGQADSTFGVNGLFISQINNQNALFTDITTRGNKHLVCLTAAGKPDSSFATNGVYVDHVAASNNGLNALTMDNIGRVVVVGTAGAEGLVGRFKTVGEVTAITETATTGWNLYPNPAGNVIYLSGEAIAGAGINVHDYTGKLLQQIPHYTSGGIDISKLPNGVYFVSVKTTAGQTMVKQLVVAR